jgi:hypothetical protein
LWGLERHGASGVTRVGLRAPPLPVDASHGDSKVFVNGRELAQGELGALARLLGWPLETAASYAGRYLLDEHGGLYGPGNRYLGNLVQAGSKLGSSAGTCCLFRFGERGILGRAVTIECD